MLDFGSNTKRNLANCCRCRFDIRTPEALAIFVFIEDPKERGSITADHFQPLEPPMIEALIELTDRALGYHLYASVEQSKCVLSETSSTRFWFSEGTVNIEELLSQDQFEAWIQPQIEQINSCIHRLLHQCNVAANESTQFT